MIAGVGKVTHPAPARAAARAVGLPVSRSAVVAFGLFEIGAGVAGALFGGPAALAVAVAYVALAGVAVALLVRAPAAPCACLGSASAVVTPTHVAINVGAAAFAVGASTGAAPLAELSDHWLSGIVIAVLVVCCVQLAMLALETWPDVRAAIQEGSPPT